MAFAAPHLSLAIAHRVILPGEKQIVTVKTTPQAALTLSLTLPNGARMVQQTVTGSRGRARFTFIQPANTLSRNSRVARLKVSLDKYPVRFLSGKYWVAFASIDLIVPTQPIPENSKATIWVHTAANTLVTVQATYHADPSQLSGTTGLHGWFAATFHFVDSTPTPATVTLSASASPAGAPIQTTATVVVQAFPFTSTVILGPILHLQDGAWVRTDQIRVGEQFRVEGSREVQEPGGLFQTSIGGTVAICKGHTVLAEAPFQDAQASEHPDYAQFRLTDPVDAGALKAIIEHANSVCTLPGLDFTLLPASLQSRSSFFPSP